MAKQKHGFNGTKSDVLSIKKKYSVLSINY